MSKFGGCGFIVSMVYFVILGRHYIRGSRTIGGGASSNSLRAGLTSLLSPAPYPDSTEGSGMGVGRRDRSASGLGEEVILFILTFRQKPTFPQGLEKIFPTS